jgi:lipid-binding SYLF domain-containing protein
MILRLAMLLLALGASGELPASSREEERISRTVEAFRAHVPARFFEEAYGYAVLPSTKRFGIGLGAAWGRGVAFEQGENIGRVRFWQLSSGVQTGARTVSMIVFFRNEQAMQDFKENRLRFMGQTGFAVLGWGRAITPAYHNDVAVFAQNGFGLMIEASIAGGKLGWKP